MQLIINGGLGRAVFAAVPPKKAGFLCKRLHSSPLPMRRKSEVT